MPAPWSPAAASRPGGSHQNRPGAAGYKRKPRPGNRPPTASPPGRNIAQICAAPRGGRHTPLAARTAVRAYLEVAGRDWRCRLGLSAAGKCAVCLAALAVDITRRRPPRHPGGRWPDHNGRAIAQDDPVPPCLAVPGDPAAGAPARASERSDMSFILSGTGAGLCRGALSRSRPGSTSQRQRALIGAGSQPSPYRRS